MTIKAQTVEQFKILELLKENFEIEYIQIILVDRYTIKVLDNENKSIVFKFINNTIVWEDETDC